MNKLGIGLFSGLMLMMAFQANACTDIRLVAKDGTVMVTRSMEFAADLHSNLRSSPRGRHYTFTTPNGVQGMQWNAKYGYVYLDGANQNYVVDGMNEAGLSVEALYLPGITKYQTVPAGKEAQGLPYIAFGDWLLSNFQTIADVKQALSSVYLFEQLLPGLGNMVFPLHFSISEASGKGIVVEFIDGKMTVTDSIGVMTNNPTYSWQVTNLRNYVNLSPYNPDPIVANGMVFAATGQGAGMVGLPGDVSPPSRFVKMSFMAKNVYLAPDATALLNVSQHIINNVDIPAGLSRAKVGGKETYETTQWVVFKDLTHKLFYYRTYKDLTLHAVDLSQIDFTEKAPALMMSIVSEPYVIDMTANFRNTKPAS